MSDDSTSPTTPTNGRRQLSRRLRFEILRRDDHTCRYCGGKAPDVALTVDHVIPVALGGSDDPTNLVAACRDCNAGKTSSSPDAAVVAEVAADAMRYARALEYAHQQARELARSQDDTLREFYQGWVEVFGDDCGLIDWEQSVLRFYARGLTLEDMLRLMWATLGRGIAWRRQFNYFAGCCWNTLTERERVARELFKAGA